MPEEAEDRAPGGHPHPEEQTDSRSPATRDALAESCLPGESCVEALGVTATPGMCLSHELSLGFCMMEGLSGRPAHHPNSDRHTG